MRSDVGMGRQRVRRVTGEELDVCLEIRRVVFVGEQKVPLEDEVDGRDDQATHYLAEWRQDTSGYVDDGWVPVGTARIRSVVDNQGQRVAKAERVAVLAEHRGHGVGKALMDALETDAKRRGHTVVRLASQESAVTF